MTAPSVAKRWLIASPRHVLPTSPVSVEYSITPLAQSLQEPFVALANWALEFGPAMELAQVEYDRAHAGEINGEVRLRPEQSA